MWEETLLGLVSWYVRLAQIYYLLCVTFGVVAFIPEAASQRLPTLIQVLRSVLLNSVGRGRTYDRDAASRLGRGLTSFVDRALSANVPKHWFSHFYHLAACWNLVWLVVLGLNFSCLFGAGTVTKLLAALAHRNSLLALFCIQLHVTRRLYENYFVHKHSKEARMQLFGYVFGLFYYIFLPANFLREPLLKFKVTLEMIKSDRCNFDLGQNMEIFSSTFGPKHLFWFALFCFGNVMQYQSHQMLASLRKPKDEAEEGGKARYKIPTGIWFTYVSNPHYLAEVILYVAFISLAASWSKDTIHLMSMVVMNLLLSALLTHRWYKAEFKDYPQKRYAMFPLLA